MGKPRHLDRDIFVENVKSATRKVNTTIEDDELLDFVTEEVVDRVSLYLRLDSDDMFDPRLVSITARVVASIFNQTANTRASSDAQTSVKAISDNGQSISYGDATKNYLATVEDGELFGGFAKLLQPYRRIRGISSWR